MDQGEKSTDNFFSSSKLQNEKTMAFKAWENDYNLGNMKEQFYMIGSSHVCSLCWELQEKINTTIRFVWSCILQDISLTYRNS